MSLKAIVGLFCLLVALKANASPPLQLEVQTGFPYEIEFIKPRAETRFRLPNTLLPLHYALDIIPILDDSLGAERQFTSPGSVAIQVTCVESADSITLHSQNIVFDQDDVTIATSTGTAPTVTAVTLEADTAIIALSEALVKDQEYTITIIFEAKINEDPNGLDGLYKSSYVDAAGTTKYLATTQFEKTGARKVFPCFDEPALRATFDIRIGRRNDNGYHSLCNMPKASEDGVPIPEFPPNWVYDVYATTVNMPTYLIAIIVSDFTSETAPDELFPGVPVKTWGPPNQMEGGTGVFSAQVAAKLLAYFQEYFDSPYQIPKLDSVAIPDFEAGAMENWGLNTYRVPLMIFVEGESTQFEQWRQAAVIAHEVSHHWFGDLVTMNWWNDLWLKEGFARYLQFLGVEDAEPQLEAMNRAVVDTIQIAMDNDILSTSHPIRGSWTTDIQFQSSRIIYEKGASLIRMMQSFLTEETLNAAMRKYLDDHEYSSATQEQLFDVFTELAHRDERLPEDISVSDIMNSWTLQSGFPVVRVTRASKTKIHLTQEAFGPVVVNDEYTGPVGLWEIPVTYATEANPDFTSANWNPKLWIHSNVLLKSVVVDDADKWILVNPDARSYYRVLYDEHFETLLKAQLNSKYDVISASSRSQLLDDYFASAYNSHIGIERALDFTKYLHNEDMLVVWTTALLQLRKAYIGLTNTDAIADFKTYVGSKILPRLEAIGGDMTPGEPPITSMLRTQLLDWACSLGLDICFDTAKPLMDAWMATPNTNNIAPDIQPMIYCGAFSKGDAVLRTFIQERYFDTTLTPRHRGLLLNALACGLDSASFDTAIDLVVDAGNTMPALDRKTLLEKIAGNTLASSLVLGYLTTHKAAIIDLTGGEAAISSTITVLSTHFNTDEQIQQLEGFITANGDLSAGTVESIRASIARVGTNRDWISKHYQAIASWLTTV